MTGNLTGVDIVNAINGAVNKRFNTSLPAVTTSTFGDMAGQLRRAPAEVQNAWHDALINLVGLQIVLNRRSYESYFRKLHLAEIPTFDVQLLMIDLVKAQTYSPDADGDDFFSDEKARVKAQYANSILQIKFPISYNEESLYGAFTSEGAFMDYRQAIENALYSSLEMADVGAVKELLNKNLAEGNIFLKVTTKPVDQSSALAFTKDVKTIASDMEVEMSPKYNLAGMNDFTPKEDGVIITDTETEAITETYSLAWAFNKDFLSLKQGGQAITMATGGLAGGKVFGLYGDRLAFQIRNIVGFPKTTSQYFGNTLTMKRWLHYWALYTLAFFKGLVAFCSANDLTTPQRIEMGTEKYGQSVFHGGSSQSALDDTYWHYNRGEGDRAIISKLTFAAGTVNPLFDKYGSWSYSGKTYTYNEGGWYDWGNYPSTDFDIDPITGDFKVGKNETAPAIEIVWTSHLDPSQTTRERIIINGNEP